MIRAAAFDVDGTLFDGHQVPASTLEAISALRQNGVLIIIATGRLYEPLRQGVLGFVPDYIVAYSGHALVDRNGNYLFRQPFSRQEVRLIDDFAQTRQLAMSYKMDDIRYSNAYLSAQYREEVNHGPYVIEVVEYDPRKPYLKRDVLSAAGIMTAAQSRELAALMPAMHVYHMHSGWVDITYKSLNKADTLEMLLNRLGIAWAECIAFGDGLNDIPMLKKAGIGVCMGNGYAETKAAADQVADTIDNDGLYKMCRKLQLI